MSLKGLRIAPPRISVPGAVDWFFARAFGPSEIGWSGRIPTDIQQLETFVGALGLLPRIWSRTDRELLARELTPSELLLIERDFRQSVAIELRDVEACRDLVELAVQLGIPLVFLKGVALRLGGYVQAGVRRAADIDVLVSQRDAKGFYQALLDQGGRGRDLPPSDQHLPIFEHPSGALVEVHHRLRGVDLTSHREGQLEGLGELGLLQELGGNWQGASIPTRELLVAHLLVHALGQHGFWPSAYPQVQMLADMNDLGLADSGERVTLDAVVPLIEPKVGREEVDAIRSLVHRLSTGEPIASIVQRDDRPGLMSRHILAGALDPGYRQALKAEGALHLATGHSRHLNVGATLRKALFPTHGQIDIIYGQPKSELGYWGRRLWRPFDLLRRVMQSAGAWMRVRRQ